ncbi:MAG TPA: PD-(D/E)XK nuclease family protein [Solirubrobacteraceae bacterium]
MALTLILGPANSAKARETLSAYAAAAPRGALLVVPTRADARHYARELAEQHAVLGRVLTFSGLAGEIARRTDHVQRPISNLARERVLGEVVAGLEFDVLGQSAEASGFVLAAAELVAELERSLITPQRFAQALKRWAAQDERRGRYAAEVASVYQGYARRLEEMGRVDRELYVWRALDALRAAPGRWGADQVFFYGFDDLHPLERDAVETLAGAVETQVTLSLTYEAGRPALQARAEVVEELRQLAGRVVELPALDEYYEPGSRRVLHHLERWLFATAPERVEPGDAVALFEAGGQRAEAELVGAEVLSLLRAGVPGHEIAVVCRSLAGAGPLIEGVFDQYGIPVAIERRVPFAATALGRALIALVRCALEGDAATPADVLCYLRAPGVLGRPEKADAVEAEVRRDSLRTAGQALQRLGFVPEALIAVRGARDPVAELGRQGRRLLAAPFIAQARLLGPSEALDARALSTMLAALGELQELRLLPSAAGLVDLLRELEVDAGRPLRPGAVQVSEPLAIRARRFQAVFACGLQESEFPQPALPEPFFSDERRREVAMASGLRLAPAEDALHRERYLFYSAVSRATARVVLSFRSSDEEGNLALPSPFIDDVAELLSPEWRERRRRRLLSDVVWSPELAPTERELRHALVAATGPAPAPDLAAPAATEGPRVLSAEALAHVRHSRIVSGSALELYATCPVKWLVEREVSPPRFDPEPDPLAKGSYMHTILEEVVGRLDRAITPESLRDAERLLAEVMADMPPTISPGRPASVRAGVQAGIRADLLRYLRHEAGDGTDWKPVGLEQHFGFEDDEGSLPALVLGGEDDQVLVRGSIDRVDVDRESGRRAIIRDYKSGTRRDEWHGSRWRTDDQLQVALYMLAARQLMDLDPVAGLYQPLGGNDLRGRGIYVKEAGVGDRLVATDAREPSELDDELHAASARAVELAHRLRTGALEPCPQTCSRQGCAYPGICRSEL